jgi:2-phospho-L-lactate/phosphoenolpyruvate guanylyltransferase
MWTLIPLKSPAQAKTRLAGALSAAARRRLYFALAARVLQAARAAHSSMCTVVVTPSAEVAAFVRPFGAMVLREPQASSTAQACRYALQHPALPRDEPVLMLSGDLPLVSADDIDSLASQLCGGPQAVIAPDRCGRGTNALLCSAPDVMPPCFGADSFARHLAVAGRLGVPCIVHRREGLDLNVDTADDLHAWYRRDPRAPRFDGAPPEWSGARAPATGTPMGTSCWT